MNEKDIYKRWLNSAKYKELQAKKRKMKKNYTKEQVLKMVRDRSEFLRLSSFDKEAFDWLDFIRQNKHTKDSVLNQLIEIIMLYTYYLYKYELTEEFEMCCILVLLIEMEILEARRIISTYFIPTDEDFECLDIMKEEAYAATKANWK